LYPFGSVAGIDYDWHDLDCCKARPLAEVNSRLRMLMTGCAQPMTQTNSSNSSTHARHFALRLKPGDELKSSLQKFVTDHNLRAAASSPASAVSLAPTSAWPDAKDGIPLEGKFEIVSLVGTLCPDGAHLHLAISDEMAK